MNNTLKAVKAVKTVTDCRRDLAQAIVDVRSGKITAATLNAIINGFGKIFTSIKLEMDYCKAVGTTPHIDFIMPAETKQKKLTGKEK